MKKATFIVSLILIISLSACASETNIADNIETTSMTETEPITTTAVTAKAVTESSLVETFAMDQTIVDEEDFVVEDGVLTKYKGKGGDVIIPNSVKAIGDSAFYANDSVKTVLLPDSVLTIGKSAFEGCTKMQKINFPDGLLSMEYSSFAGCEQLTEINLPSKINNIPDYCFAWCSKLKTINIPDGTTYIGEAAFAACLELNELFIPESVNVIIQNAFANCTNIKISYRGNKYDESNVSSIYTSWFEYIGGEGKPEEEIITQPKSFDSDYMTPLGYLWWHAKTYNVTAELGDPDSIGSNNGQTFYTYVGVNFGSYTTDVTFVFVGDGLEAIEYVTPSGFDWNYDMRSGFGEPDETDNVFMPSYNIWNIKNQMNIYADNSRITYYHYDF